MTHIPSQTNLKFKQVTSGDRIKFTKDKPGYNSHVSRIGGQQRLNLGYSACFVMGVVVHELLHAAGMIHEHQRPDRDKYLTIDESNLTDLGKHNILNEYAVSEISELTPFDYGSIMIYRSLITSKRMVIDDKKFTIVPKQDVKIGQRDGLSPRDIETINRRCN